MRFAIGTHSIGDDSPAFIIAELSCNHGQDKQIAIDTVYAAKAAGADAIKLQTFTPDTITIDCSNKYFQITQGTLWDGQTLHSLYKTAYTPWEWHAELFEHAKKAGLISFSSPFDPTAVKFLAELNVPAYKIASFEINDIPLIRLVAQQGKPVIISTGIATLEEIEEAVKTCREAGNNQIALLKCTSSYPAKLAEANLQTIPDLASRFGVIAGLSDHTLGATAPAVAVTLGARLLRNTLF